MKLVLRLPYREWSRSVDVGSLPRQREWMDAVSARILPQVKMRIDRAMMDLVMFGSCELEIMDDLVVPVRQQEIPIA